MNTPWGQADQVENIKGHDGIVWCTTPSHGGFWLSDMARKQMPKALRDIQTFAGGNWYEEDCDAAIIPLAFPAYFTAKQVHAAAAAALATIGMWRAAEAVIAWYRSDDAGAILTRAHVETHNRAMQRAA